MKQFLLGVAVGAAAMGYYTGYVKIFIGPDSEETTKPEMKEPKTSDETPNYQEELS